ncbi:kinase-like domain-containing protein, partial [Polychytrium aggregatum]|uniref:kinase-like domain-containing protein n=1 Tax=Polychytrium aggregatum TaxID=110093 RepID=UPI0022FF0F7A
MSTETSSRNIAAESITNWTLAPIAHGGWGEVFKASYNDAVVAVKQPFRGHSDAELVEFRKEIAIWRRLNHRHVLPLFGACDNNSKHCIVSPFMPNGTLHDYVRDPANIRPLEEKLCLLRQVALGMAYLHSNNVVHGDLKPMNVLLDASFSAVISDFGLSHIWTDSAQTNNQQGVSVCGTPGFMAPELLGSNHEAQTTKRSDVFAFAITILTVLNNAATPWVLSSQSMGGYTVCNYVLEGGRPSRFEGIPDDVWQLVSDCWKQDPNDRPEFPSIV